MSRAWKGAWHAVGAQGRSFYRRPVLSARTCVSGRVAAAHVSAELVGEFPQPCFCQIWCEHVRFLFRRQPSLCPYCSFARRSLTTPSPPTRIPRPSAQSGTFIESSQILIEGLLCASTALALASILSSQPISVREHLLVPPCPVALISL